VHEGTLEGVGACFAGFQKSDRRMRLFNKLRSYLEAVKQADCADAVIIDGSFVMACVDEPEDIDVILVLHSNWDAQADLRPYLYNLVSSKRVKLSWFSLIWKNRLVELAGEG
jgi:hypothetical protein